MCEKGPWVAGGTLGTLPPALRGCSGERELGLGTQQSGCIGQPLGIHVSPGEVWRESLSRVSKLQPKGQMLFSVACELRMALHF